MPVQIGNHNGIKISAFDFKTGEKVGEYDSMHKAARSLFIKSPDSIRVYLYGKYGSSTFTRKKTGVKSYKTGKKYHFEVIK